MSEKPEAENAGAVWMMATIALCLGMICGCPPVRRQRVKQQMRGWQVEKFDRFQVSATNGVINLEIGGAGDGR